MNYVHLEHSIFGKETITLSLRAQMDALKTGKSESYAPLSLDTTSLSWTEFNLA